LSTFFQIRTAPARIARLIAKVRRKAWPPLPRLPSKTATVPSNDDEFYRRVLLAVEKPPRSKLVAIINSGFFLWILTACVVSAGGAYLTSYQQCRKDADDAIERYTKVERELFQRELKIQGIILSNSSISAIKEKLSAPNSYYPEFAGFPTQTLRESNAGFLNRVIDLRLPLAIDSPSPDLLKLFTVANGNIPDGLTDKDLGVLREFARTILAQARPIPLPGFGLSQFEPACGPRTLIDRFFHGTSVDIVRSSAKRPSLPKVLPPEPETPANPPVVPLAPADGPPKK